MHLRGSTFKLITVSVLVVFTLTGFSTESGHNKRRSGSHKSGSGGCSSSSQKHDSYSRGRSHRHHDDDRPATGSGGSASPSPSLRSARVDLLSCVSKTAPYATVEVTNPNSVAGTFKVSVTFEDEAGARVVTRTRDVAVPARDTAKARVTIDNDRYVARISECDPARYAPVTR